MAEQHLNTFEKGMTSDVSILYQPNGTYRYMKNCQLISQDGNNFVVKDCLGNVKMFTLNVPYSGTTATRATSPTPIGFISFPDKLFVFSTNNTSEDGGYGQIGVFDYQPFGEGYRPEGTGRDDENVGYRVLYHHESLKFTQLRQIEGFAFEENESLKRIYWTDNLNQPRTLNVTDPIFTTYYTGAADLTIGERYMVLQGAVEYDGVDYGPGLTDGNIFTATVGGGTSFTDLTGPTIEPLVIKYLPVELLDFTPARALGNIKFDSYGSGSVYCGSKIYFYRLLNATEGITTSWSYGSSPIQVGTENTTPGVLANVYFDFSGGGQATLTNSTYSVNVTISDIDTNFDVIELACAEFDETLNVPRQITIVNSVNITGTEMTIEHNGQLNLGALTLNDITLFPTSIITCKTMTTNKNYILVGNITERADVGFDNGTVSVSQTDYYMPVSDSSQGCATGLFDFNWIGPNPNGSPAAGEILFGTKWRVSSVTGTGTATYNAVVYNDGDIFTGVAGVQALTGTTGDAQVRPVVSYNKYTPINGSADRQNYIQLKEVYNGAAYWNYKNPAVAAHIKGYWNGEKYRFGLLFYDKQGNPFYVKHLADYTFDDQNTAGISYLDTSGAVDVVGLKAHGVKFSGIEIEKSVVDKISGFSIVRAERDKRILTQCAMWQIGSDITNPAAVNYYPVATLKQNTIFYNTNAAHRYCLICPDLNSGYPDITATTANFSYLELASWFDVDTLMSDFKAKDVANQFETQLFDESLGDTNGVVTKSIVYVEEVDEAETIVGSFNESGAEFFNNCYIGANLNIDTACVGGGATPTDLGNSVARGGKKLIIELDTTEADFLYNSTATAYSNLAVAGDAKANVNIVFDKTVFYGGDSELALANTIYIQCGHYQPITDEVIADNNDTNDPAAYTKLTFDDVEVYGGDAYTCLVDYGYGLFDDSGTIVPPGVPVTDDYYSYAIKFPCQLNANYDLRSGRTTAKNRMHATANGVAYYDGTGPRLEQFFYNEAYSSEGTSFAYAAQPLNFLNNSRFRTRIRFAGPKINGESPNSFRSFLANDYKDMDGQGGEINNLRTKDARTVVWQNAMVSTVPILERQVVSGLAGAETTIGTGGVVDRFDPITSYFGNQHQWGLTLTEFGYVWFDMRRKAFVALDFGAGVQELSLIEGLSGFFNEVFVENRQFDEKYTEYINSPDYDIYSDRPLTGFGITGVYDPKLKMTYLTFKFLLRSDNAGVINDIAKDFTIGYYHPSKMFVGFYDFLPSISWNHNQLVLSANNPKNPTKYYGPNMASTNFVIGDVIGDGTKTYTCITNYTVPTYVSPPNATYFTETANTNQLWLLNNMADDGRYISDATTYQYNKFFGIVVDNEMTFVINPQTQNPFAVLNIEQEGNNVNFTDLYIDAGGISASDTSISSSNRWYRVIWDKICSSMPLSTTGRIVNSYLQVRWVKKNWADNKLTLTGSVKVLRNIKSFFIQKR